jgi:hypothetical protein
MAVVHVKYACRDCPFVTTDSVEAEQHADAERHCVEVSGEIQPRVRPGLHTDTRPAQQTSSDRGFPKANKAMFSVRFVVLCETLEQKLPFADDA